MAQKRHSNGWEPPSKRHHSENGLPAQSNDFRRTGSMPELPRITIQYESQVFTHQSALTPVDSGSHDKSYERLEFLGDAYLELFASRLIWQKYPSLPAGKMSQLRESLVKNETLAKISSSYDFDMKLRRSGDQLNEKAWNKIRADMFEAYVAAVVLSDPVNGSVTAESWMAELWTPMLIIPSEKKVPDMQSKVQLSGKIGGRKVKIDYVEERTPVLEKGDQVFFIGAYLTGWGWDNQHLGSGKGTSKGAAGNDAAARALQNTTLIEEIVAVKKAALGDRQTAETKEDNSY